MINSNGNRLTRLEVVASARCQRKRKSARMAALLKKEWDATPLERKTYRSAQIYDQAYESVTSGGTISSPQPFQYLTSTKSKTDSTGIDFSRGVTAMVEGAKEAGKKCAEVMAEVHRAINEKKR